MPQELPGFKGLVLSYLKGNNETLCIPDDPKVESIYHDDEDGTWKVYVDLYGDRPYHCITLDSEDLMGFMWNKISMMCGEQ